MPWIVAKWAKRVLFSHITIVRVEALKMISSRPNPETPNSHRLGQHLVRKLLPPASVITVELCVVRENVILCAPALASEGLAQMSLRAFCDTSRRDVISFVTDSTMIPPQLPRAIHRLNYQGTTGITMGKTPPELPWTRITHYHRNYHGTTGITMAPFPELPWPQSRYIRPRQHYHRNYHGL